MPQARSCFPYRQWPLAAAKKSKNQFGNPCKVVTGDAAVPAGARGLCAKTKGVAGEVNVEEGERFNSSWRGELLQGGAGRPCIKSSNQAADRKQKGIVNRVKWADEVGRELKETRTGIKVLLAKCGRGFIATGVDGVSSKREDEKWVRLAGRCRRGDSIPGKEEGGDDQPAYGRPSYKEVLMLHGLKQPTSTSNSSAGSGASFSKRKVPTKLRQVGKCFKCLAVDHRVADCRDPVRCIT